MRYWRAALLFILIEAFFLTSPISSEETTSSKATAVSKSKGSSTLHAKPPVKRARKPLRGKKNIRTKSGRKTSRKKVNKIRGQREIESSRVLQIQSALAGAGFFRGEPTGQWDQATAEAMKAYQQSNGFKMTGKPDALSLKKLGL